MKTMGNKGRGGRRPGAGRKRDGIELKVPMAFSIEPSLKARLQDFLKSNEMKVDEFVERALDALASETKIGAPKNENPE